MYCYTAKMVFDNKSHKIKKAASLESMGGKLKPDPERFFPG